MSRNKNHDFSHWVDCMYRYPQSCIQVVYKEYKKEEKEPDLVDYFPISQENGEPDVTVVKYKPVKTVLYNADRPWKAIFLGTLEEMKMVDKEQFPDVTFEYINR